MTNITDEARKALREACSYFNCSKKDEWVNEVEEALTDANLTLIPAAELAELRGKVSIMESAAKYNEELCLTAQGLVNELVEACGYTIGASPTEVLAWMAARKAEQVEAAQLRKLVECADYFEIPIPNTYKNVLYMTCDSRVWFVGKSTGKSPQQLYKGIDRAAAETAFLAAVAEIEGGEK